MESIVNILSTVALLGNWGYLFIFVISILESTAALGLIVPGTTITIVAGFLVSQKIFNLAYVIWLVAIGGIIGDSVSFYLGRRGTHLFKSENKILKLAHLEKGKEFFHRHGSKSIVLARFIGPLRPIVPFVAGLVHMPTKKFFIFNIIGGMAAAIFYVLVGDFFGSAWRQIHHFIRHFEGDLLVIVVVLFFGYYLRDKIFYKH